ncbi:hypothetical protein B484DRAFT_56404 [Ochromonadaceae sp. CCMP2298]|nr:hypothetical protein B484DRAFT_56404 [Ochromonadaceae sp. CCMP2298]
MRWNLLLALLVLAQIPLVFTDNPTSIVQPFDGPDPGYILAESTSGLSNRLRVMAAYMFIAQSKFDGAHLVFVWDKTSACPGHFLSIFEPIDGVVFATNSSRYVLDKKAKIVYENSFAVFNWIMQMNHIPKNRHGLPSWAEGERQMYSRFFPTMEVMLKASAFINKHDICNCSAMHLRTTDLDKVLGSGKRTHLPAYFRFVESRPPAEKVFILTDNPKTQRLFLQKYGPDKILVYSAIASEEEQPPLFVTSAGGQGGQGGSVPTGRFGGAANSSMATGAMGTGAGAGRRHSLAEDHRFTTLEHTLIDVIIAAHAQTFKPSSFSSLSDLVRMFEHIGKRERGWCS